MNREAQLLRDISEDIERNALQRSQLHARRIRQRQAHLDAQLVVQQIQISQSIAA
jgi:hypothetical protein